MEHFSDKERISLSVLIIIIIQYIRFFRILEEEDNTSIAMIKNICMHKLTFCRPRMYKIIRRRILGRQPDVSPQPRSSDDVTRRTRSRRSRSIIIMTTKYHDEVRFSACI